MCVVMFGKVWSCVQMENQVIVSDYSQMDRILREERQYLLNICKKIKKAGCNVLFVQKSILRYGRILCPLPHLPHSPPHHSPPPPQGCSE